MLSVFCVLKKCPSGLTYPLIYLKVCVQAQKEAPLLSTWGMAKKIVGQNGVLGLWQGEDDLLF